MFKNKNQSVTDIFNFLKAYKGKHVVNTVLKFAQNLKAKLQKMF